jgi:LPXTG-motif cell wall-anchored protein
MSINWNGLKGGVASVEDLFSGGGGSQNQGTPTTSGPGDGGKSGAITNWLSVLTGAYESVTGAGTQNGPAPAAQATPAVSKSTPWLLYGGVALAVVALLWLLKKR